MRKPRTTSLIKPIGYSLAAFTGLALLVGVFVIPHEVTQFRNPHAVSITQFMIDEQRNLALLLCRRTPARSETSIDYEIAVLKLDGRGESLPQVVNVTKPICMTRVGDQLIVGELDGTIRSIPLADERASTVVGQQPDEPAIGLAGSRDGCVLLTWCERKVCVWDLSAKKLVRELPFVATIALVSADSNSFYCDVRSGIAERDMVSGEVLRVIVEDGMMRAAALSPDGCQLASISHNGRLRVTDLKSGATAWCTSVAGDLAVSKTLNPVVLPILAFSPDGNRVLSAHQLERAWGVSIWNAKTGDVEKSFHAHQTCIAGADFSNTDFLYTSADQSLKKWDLTSSNKVVLIGDWNTVNWKMPHE